jgi:hypothetical protein
MCACGRRRLDVFSHPQTLGYRAAGNEGMRERGNERTKDVTLLVVRRRANGRACHNPLMHVRWRPFGRNEKACVDRVHGLLSTHSTACPLHVHCPLMSAPCPLHVHSMPVRSLSLFDACLTPDA